MSEILDEIKAHKKDCRNTLAYWKELYYLQTDNANYLKAKNEKLNEIVEAVAHIGVDFGYGKYVLEDKFIKQARKILTEPEIKEATND